MISKHAVRSKTLWGILIAVAPQILEAFGVDAASGDVGAIVSGLGAILAIVGRFRARKSIEVIPAARVLPLVVALGAGAMLLALPACQTVEQHPGLAQLAVQYATVKIAQNNPDHVPRIVAIAGQVRAAAGGDSANTVDMLVALARTKIDFAQLDPADRLLVDALLAEVGAQLRERLGPGLLGPEQLLVVAQVAGWIEAAALSVGPAR